MNTFEFVTIDKPAKRISLRERRQREESPLRKALKALEFSTPENPNAKTAIFQKVEVGNTVSETEANLKKLRNRLHSTAYQVTQENPDMKFSVFRFENGGALGIAVKKVRANNAATTDPEVVADGLVSDVETSASVTAEEE